MRCGRCVSGNNDASPLPGRVAKRLGGGELFALSERVDSEWQCLVRVLGPAFAVAEDVIATLLETGNPATFAPQPMKKLRLPANILPKAKECERIIAVYDECISAQRQRCSKPFDFSMNLSNATRADYYSIAERNMKFGRQAFVATCRAVCRQGNKALTEKAITANFCG